MKKKKIKSGKAIAYGILILFFVIMVVPMIWMILMSFKSTSEIMNGSVFSLPEQFNFNNYVVAWTEGKIKEYFLNSVIVTITATFFVIVFGATTAYALSRMKWRLKDTVLNFFLLGMMIPIHATLVPVFVTLKNLHLLNSYLCLILPYIASGLPMAIYIFKGFIIGIPHEMEEAAALDGCSTERAFVSVILPILKPAVITVVILTFLQFWNEYVMASTLVQNTKLNTLPIGMQAFKGEFSVDWGSMCAGIVVSALPIFVLYMIFNKTIDRSIAVGAMK